ncbi:hypothetical protein SALBM311S_11569 [Streptomyces alboniger]
MGDDDHRHAVLGQAAHDVEDLADELGVEGGGGLVEEHQLRFHRQRAGDGDTLLLTTGELRGVLADLVAETHPVQQPLRALPGDGLGLALDLDRRLGDVLQRRHVGEEVEALEHHADVPPLRGHFLFLQLVELVATLPVADQVAVDVQSAGADLLQVVDAPQEGRLAGAGRTDQAEHLARVHLQVDALEDVREPEGLVHALGLDHRPAARVLGDVLAETGHRDTSGRRNEPNMRRFFLRRCSGVGGRLREEPRA